MTPIPNLTTHDGLAEHYAAVRARLRLTDAAPTGIDDGPRERDWLHLASRPPLPSWRHHAFGICVRHGVSMADIMSERRTARIAAARHEIMWTLYTVTTMSAAQIGRVMRRDHSTVLAGIKRHAARMAAAERAGQPVPETWGRVG